MTGPPLYEGPGQNPDGCGAPSGGREYGNQNACRMIRVFVALGGGAMRAHCSTHPVAKQRGNVFVPDASASLRPPFQADDNDDGGNIGAIP